MGDGSRQQVSGLHLDEHRRLGRYEIHRPFSRVVAQCAMQTPPLTGVVQFEENRRPPGRQQPHAAARRSTSAAARQSRTAVAIATAPGVSP
ncbi:hypothetical protein TPCV4_03030 [Cutibacterium avidum]|nr:hypothetical protein TPCV4_03030 [Cutibacterium avidum]